MTDSSTGGYLLPNNPPAAPIEDAALDEFMGDIIAGCTGLDRDKFVRPRWQLDVPNAPARNVNWVAFGVMRRRADTFAVEQHDPTDQGTDVMIRHEELDLLASFYGPNCQAYGTLLRDGLSIAQNREPLFLAGMGVISVGDVTRAPEMLKSAWYGRADLPYSIRREVRRVYPVLNLLSAAGTVFTAGGPTTSFNA
ncbi:MAG TPA: hypothetical protein VF477_18900 [Mycobacterium sp.]